MYDSTELPDNEITVAHTNYMETLKVLGKNIRLLRDKSSVVRVVRSLGLEVVK